MKLYGTLSALLILALQPNSVMAQYHTDRGAVLGGLTGALAGAAIGDHNDNAGAGALIGGAVGLVTGAAIGNSVDQEEAARARAYQQQRAWQLARAASIPDVVQMSRSGVADDIIIKHISQNGIQRRLETADVISLHQQGVSTAVIAAMQRAPVGAPLPQASYPSTYSQPVYQPPVVVQEHYYVSPPPVNYWHGYRPYRPPYHPPHRSNVHWGITIGR